MPQVSIDFNQPIPLFPLPNCVLLPHATIPLHIFEPRYRAMVNAALDSRGLIALASFADDDWKDHYHKKPPLRPYVCIGYIVRHERMTDGRYNILLQGVCRAHIREELDDVSLPYRQAMLEPVESIVPMEIDMETERQTLEQLLNDPLLKSLASISAIHNWLSQEIPTPIIVDLSIMMICDSMDQRYRMLEERDTFVRTRWLTQHLQGMRRTLQIAQKHDDGASKDGYALN